MKMISTCVLALIGIGISGVALAATLSDAIRVQSITTKAPDNAFTLDILPNIAIKLSNTANTAWNGMLRVDDLDLYTEQITSDYVEEQVAANGQATVDYAPKLAYSVHRLTVHPADGKADAQLSANASYTTVAYGPAKLAKDLPDDWPLATHHYEPEPILHAPMAGFKWYRCFSGQVYLNPKKGVYDWSGLDATVKSLKAIGGKLLINMEEFPTWMTKNGSDHGLPNDWHDVETFVKDLVARYDDGSGVLAAVEPWNEPNANCRWTGTPEELVRLHRIWFDATRKTKNHIQVVGITVSPGHHVDCVEGLTEAGILDVCDIVGGHYYEEIGSLDRFDTRNNFVLHTDLLSIPLRRAKKYMPIWDTESGMGAENSNGQPRPAPHIPSQNELVASLQANPGYDPANPWATWQGPGERREAALVISHTVTAMAAGVEKTFTFMGNWYCLDHTLILPWVTNATFGSVLSQVDYHYIMPVNILGVGGGPDIAAVGYRIGKPGGKQVVVLWAQRLAPKSHFQAGWTKWVDPVPVQLPSSSKEVTVQDMYLRGETKVPVTDIVQAGTHYGVATINVGEEPVFIWGWQFEDI
jgi:hypothetical protein